MFQAVVILYKIDLDWIGIRTTLTNPKFDANSVYLIETNPNSSVFEVQIKVLRQLDGKTIHIGDECEISYLYSLT